MEVTPLDQYTFNTYKKYGPNAVSAIIMFELEYKTSFAIFFPTLFRRLCLPDMRASF